ncbi:MAG: hypothetical protein OXC61_01920 [Flavobacteriaceae bacterium]|nr:hypothetical protein [Flavobacteriaceae bacterium]
MNYKNKRPVSRSEKLKSKKISQFPARANEIVDKDGYLRNSNKKFQWCLESFDYAGQWGVDNKILRYVWCEKVMTPLRKLEGTEWKKILERHKKSKGTYHHLINLDNKNWDKKVKQRLMDLECDAHLPSLFSFRLIVPNDYLESSNLVIDKSSDD